MHPVPIIAALLLAMAPLARADTMPRQITGSVSLAAEDVTLPASAEAVVEMRGADGALLAEMLLPPPAAGEALSFALAVPADAAGILRAGILLTGAVLWTSAPVQIAAAAGDTVLPAMLLTPHIAHGSDITLVCGTEPVDFGYSGGAAILHLRGEVFRLPQVPAASGARFSDEADPETSVHSRGGSARVVLRGESLPECREALVDSTFPLRATGNEPFWRLDLSAEEGMLLTNPEGIETASDSLPAPEPIEGGLRMVSGTLEVEMRAHLCRDTMTGMPHPLSVRLITPDGTNDGCGGAPLSLLTGREWRAVRIEDQAISPETEVSLSFDTEGRVSGRAACNLYLGGYELSGEGLSVSPLASTRMACADPLMEIEGRVLELLPRVDRFDIDTEGGLVLISGDRQVLRALR
ncbi:MAG: META domain-containing protein [Rhodobacteraceae bacterium]|nr:META domain-containing protein [Paracoccaceae bacterium]